MPNGIKTNNGILYYWFNPILSEGNKSSIKASLKRQLERCEIDEKLSLLYPEARISRLENGVPIIKGIETFKYISISHSKNWFAIYLAKTPIGIDIQTLSRDLKKGSFYFINENEERWATTIENRYLIWCAKESIIKKYKGEIINLKSEITIIEIGNEIVAKYKSEKEIVHFIKLEKCFLTWTM